MAGLPRLITNNFIGSEATRYVNQQTEDIHLFQYFNNPNPLPLRLRQRGVCLAPFVTGITFEVSFVLPAGNAIVGPWFNTAALVGFVFFNITAFGGPQWLFPALAMGPQPATAMAVNGIPTMGYSVPWLYMVEETHNIPGIPPNHFYYYQHKPRTSHRVVPAYDPQGSHYYFVNALRFGTQIQEYRQGR